MSTSKNSRPRKRRRTDFGANDDVPTPQAQASAPSATALSIRVLPPEHFPTLASLCIQVFADNLFRLANENVIWEEIQLQLHDLPEYLVPRVFAALKSTCPTILSNGLIVAYFLRGTSIALDKFLTGVNKHTIASIRESPIRTTLRELRLDDFDKEPDSFFASVISQLPSLQILVLRGCTKVGQKSMEAVAEFCPNIMALNLNYTSVLPINLASVLLACAKLEVLKVAGITSWTDTSFAKLSSVFARHEDLQLQLRTLKLRQTSLSDAALEPFFALCTNLKRVDISFTLVRRPSHLLERLSLEKLSLTSTNISGAELLATASNLPDLTTLNIAVLGGGQGSSAAISNSSAMSLTDQTLRDLTSILETSTCIERINLVGNTKLGMTRTRDSALADFISRVGRRCKGLNMASIPSLRSSDLEGLLPATAEGGPAQLQTLTLNNTGVGDEAAPYISSALSLETLAVAGTRFTSAGLFPIIDACEKLRKLDLTSCRGVKVGDRRRFFEAWEEEWKNK